MRDVVMLAVITAFFLVCVAYVRWCDRIVGPDAAELSDEAPAIDEAEQVAA